MPHCKQLQHTLLSKIVNAERASYHAPKFLKLTVRYLYIIAHTLTLLIHISIVSGHEWYPI